MSEVVPGAGVSSGPSEPAAADPAAADTPPASAEESGDVNSSAGLTQVCTTDLDPLGVIVLRRNAERSLNVAKPIKNMYRSFRGVLTTYVGSSYLPTNPFGLPVVGSLFNFLLGGAPDKYHAVRKLVDNQEQGEDLIITQEKNGWMTKIFGYSTRKLELVVKDSAGAVTGKFQKTGPFCCKRSLARFYDPAGNLLGMVKKVPICGGTSKISEPIKAQVLYEIFDASETATYRIVLPRGCGAFCACGRKDTFRIIPFDKLKKQGGISVLRTHKCLSPHSISGGIFSKLQARIRVKFPVDADPMTKYLIYQAALFQDYEQFSA